MTTWEQVREHWDVDDRSKWPIINEWLGEHGEPSIQCLFAEYEQRLARLRGYDRYPLADIWADIQHLRGVRELFRRGRESFLTGQYVEFLAGGRGYWLHGNVAYLVSDQELAVTRDYDHGRLIIRQMAVDMMAFLDRQFFEQAGAEANPENWRVHLLSGQFLRYASSRDELRRQQSVHMDATYCFEELPIRMRQRRRELVVATRA